MWIFISRAHSHAFAIQICATIIEIIAILIVGIILIAVEGGVIGVGVGVVAYVASIIL